SGALIDVATLAPSAGLLVMVICNHCPYVKHIRSHLAPFAARYAPSGIQALAVSGNDPDVYPEDAPDALVREARVLGFGFPYLYDETQDFLRSLHAACTPELFLFDGERKLFYCGRFDGSSPGNRIPVTGDMLGAACDRLLRGENPPSRQLPAIGCSIKWRSVTSH
ncbi:alkyl hydroperoxide reductase/ Thiol specific antioxidant/ Mal allergen, partial [mine drainage metagenome]